ncbi:hypothetical protein ACFUEM_25175 [Streptomyces anulatus]|uniref:hypothetical protein n=1 Tax=Streptomyces anulatus TaxID=1892 RepID=UPI0035E27F1E
MVELLSLLRRLFHQPADARFDSFQLGIWNPDWLQFPVRVVFRGFGHEWEGLLEGRVGEGGPVVDQDVPQATESYGRGVGA